VTGEDIGVALARLRKLEQGLRAERERIRAAAAGEILQLQNALRETAARAAERDREAQLLRRELQRGAGGRRFRRPRLRRESDTSGALERVLANFELERRGLEERARAVAQTELRQRKAEDALQAEAQRLTKASGELEDRRRLSTELRAAERRIEKLEQQLHEHEQTKAALAAAEVELAALARVEQQRRQAEAALVAAQVGPLAGRPETDRDVEARIAALLAARELELDRRAAETLERSRAQLKREAAAELDRERDRLEVEWRADVDRQERELAGQMAESLIQRREELEREAAEAKQRGLAGSSELLDRERAALQDRELELVRREEALAQREIQLSLVRRRVGDEERRLQERTWRTGALPGGEPVPVVVRTGGEVSFSEGWRRLAGRPDEESAEAGGWPGWEPRRW
jgi:DNA repair exonuclease SbcCD ATPase subunit